jgi:hypothetical protein
MKAGRAKMMIWLPGTTRGFGHPFADSTRFQTHMLRAAVVCSLVPPKQPSSFTSGDKCNAAHERQCSLICASPTWDWQRRPQRRIDFSDAPGLSGWQGIT